MNLIALALIFILASPVGAVAQQTESEKNAADFNEWVTQRDKDITRDSVLKVKRGAEQRVKARQLRENNRQVREAKWRAAGWTDVIIAAVRAKEVLIGMNLEMVKAAWGPYETINSTTTAAGTEYQVVYGLGRYVYFGTDGRVRTIQR
jgi:hypothetical protein